MFGYLILSLMSFLQGDKSFLNFDLRLPSESSPKQKKVMCFKKLSSHHF